MPKFTVTEDEKQALKGYFDDLKSEDHGLSHIAKESQEKFAYYLSLLTDFNTVNFSSAHVDAATNTPFRFLVMNVTVDGNPKTIKVPFHNLDPVDPGSHECTQMDNKLFFHQGKAELPANFNIEEYVENVDFFKYIEELLKLFEEVFEELEYYTSNDYPLNRNDRLKLSLHNIKFNILEELLTTGMLDNYLGDEIDLDFSDKTDILNKAAIYSKHYHESCFPELKELYEYLNELTEYLNELPEYLNQFSEYLNELPEPPESISKLIESFNELTDYLNECPQPSDYLNELPESLNKLTECLNELSELPESLNQLTESTNELTAYLNKLPKPPEYLNKTDVKQPFKNLAAIEKRINDIVAFRNDSRLDIFNQLKSQNDISLSRSTLAEIEKILNQTDLLSRVKAVVQKHQKKCKQIKSDMALRYCKDERIKDANCESNFFNIMVIYLQDEDDRLYMMHITTSNQRENVEYQTRVKQDTPTIYRYYENEAIRIEITPYYGQDLHDYLEYHKSPKNNEPLSDEKKEIIAHALLQQYVDQIFNKGIVHTDINTTNVCIQEEDGVIKVHYIDFKESFPMDEEPNPGIKGSAGYLAREFFGEDQQDTYNIEKQAFRTDSELKKAYKPNHYTYFSAKTDAFALGRLILKLKLPATSLYLTLANALTHEDPNQRLTGSEINIFLKKKTTLNDKELTQENLVNSLKIYVSSVRSLLKHSLLSRSSTVESPAPDNSKSTDAKIDENTPRGRSSSI